MPRRKGHDTGFELPLLPRRRGVLFPNTAGPILVGRRISLHAVEEATAADYLIAVATQRDPSQTEVEADDLYPVATEAVINRALKLPDGSTQVWVQGRRRLRIVEIVRSEPGYRVRVTPVPGAEEAGVQVEAHTRAVLALFEKVVKLSPTIPDEAYVMALNMERPAWLADFVASSLDLDDRDAQELLATPSAHERLERVAVLLARELDVLELQTSIRTQVQREVDRSQREYLLREQMKAIQKELGEADPLVREVSELRQKITVANLPPDVAARAEEELGRLEQTPAASPEGAVIRTYLDWLLNLPWNTQTEDNLDVRAAARVLDRNHYGLPTVKERILEFIAVRHLTVGRLRSPILCLVGPPGVGKTSLGRSIAEALGRRLVRVSLGGIRDEAEIRGHRRTYVGALPGRIIQALRSAGTRNPVFILDEVDKVGADFRGDPSSALLEALDPEQNHAFSDHYLEVPFDLSRVLFITTANVLDPIIPALRDRLEVIELPGYTEEEKLHIARRFLVPKQLREHGLTAGRLRFTPGALRRIIREYTREAGLRNLERDLGSICRKVARGVAEGQGGPVTVAAADVPQYLGPQRFFWGAAEESDQVGVATGVARTEMGGDVLAVEVAIMPGKGELTLTGHLGEVMRESAQAALSYARSRAPDLGIAADTFEKHDIHVHVPAGAVPKDGPSAGITIATALISALTRRTVSREVAMTGEITLRGRILPVGGIKEKVLAAHRAGMKTFVLPKKNMKDLEEVPAAARGDLRFIPATDMSEVLQVALNRARGGRRGAPGEKS